MLRVLHQKLFGFNHLHGPVDRMQFARLMSSIFLQVEAGRELESSTSDARTPQYHTDSILLVWLIARGNAIEL